MGIIEKMKRQAYTASRDKLHYTMFIEDAFSIHGECIVTGIGYGGNISIREKVWIMGPNGSVHTATIRQIQEIEETPDAQKHTFATSLADPGVKVGIWLQEIDADMVKQGFILASTCSNVENLEYPIENPFLKGSIRGKKEADLFNLEAYLQEELRTNARFLVIVSAETSEASVETMSYPYLRDGKGTMVQPVFTDWLELSIWYEQDQKRPYAAVLSLQQVYAALKENEEISGIVINAFSDNFSLDKNMIAELVRGE